MESRVAGQVLSGVLRGSGGVRDTWRGDARGGAAQRISAFYAHQFEAQGR